MRTLILALVLFVPSWKTPAQEVRTTSLSTVEDHARLFKTETVDQAKEMLRKLERETGIVVEIETVTSLNDKTVDSAAKERAENVGNAGLYLLIAAEERRISRPLVRSRYESRFPPQSRDDIREAILGGFRRGDRDDGLKRGVQAIIDSVHATAEKPEPSMGRMGPIPSSSGLVERDKIRLTLAGARHALAAAEARANEMKLAMNIAVVDDGGHLLAFARMDGARPASAATAQTKAVSAATYRQPSGPLPAKTDGPHDPIMNLGMVLAADAGGARVTTLLGGIPIVIDGQIVGAIGVGGGTGEQDAEVARVGAASVPESLKTTLPPSK